MCLFCTVACAVWETMIGRYFTVFLPWDTLIPEEPIEGAIIISLLVFFSYAIILNTVVPISLYVRYAAYQFNINKATKAKMHLCKENEFL